MKKFILASVLAGIYSLAFCQSPDSLIYEKKSYMIPMRDGILLNTVVISPLNHQISYPILLTRTPYGTGDIPPADSIMVLHRGFQFYTLAVDGYIFVLQDIRGKYKSQGSMQIHQPIVHQNQKGAVDESTDTWGEVDGGEPADRDEQDRPDHWADGATFDDRSPSRCCPAAQASAC